MEMTIQKLDNRAGRDSSHNKSFLGWNLDEAKEWINGQLDKDPSYKWNNSVYEYTKNYLHYKLSSERPITSLRRVNSVILYSKYLSNYLIGINRDLEDLELQEGKDLLSALKFTPHAVTGRILTDETRKSYIKGLQALIKFISSSRCDNPITIPAISGLAYIRDYETKRAIPAVCTYTTSDMNKLLSTDNWFNQFVWTLLYDTGCRIHEFIDSNLNDFKYDKINDVVIWEIKVTKTKNGLRSVVLAGKTKQNFEQYLMVYHNINLRDWVPSESTKDIPLLISFTLSHLRKRMCYRTLLKRFQKDCRRLEVSLPHHFKRFRSTGATIDAMNENISENAFDTKYGHGFGQGMRKRYVNRSDDRVLNTIIEFEKKKAEPVRNSGMNLSGLSAVDLINMLSKLQDQGTIMRE